MSIAARPSITQVLEAPPPRLTNADAEAIAATEYGIEAAAHVLASERDQIFLIEARHGSRYVLKIANEAEDPLSIDLQIAALNHVARHAPGVPVPRVVPTRGGADRLQHTPGPGRTHPIWLLTWLAGRMLHEVALAPALTRRLGHSLAELGRALRGFHHPAAGHTLLWDIKHLPELRALLPYVEEEALRARCERVIEEFESEAAPRLPALRGQVIYNDLNPSNVVVTDEPEPRVAGILDFGDIVHSPLICDLAVAASYQLYPDEDPLAGACELVHAYHRVTPLEDDEIDLLLDLIRARLAARCLVPAWHAGRHPENRDYILRNAQDARRGLKALAQVSRREARERFHRACGRMTAIPAAPTDELLARRRLLGSAYRLFYDRPLHLVRGEGVWLYDAEGRAYLDAYNNVPLVGHCHPRVVEALATQASLLCTHTRYLHEGVLRHAERLLALFPAALDRVMFTCTGSEANELALRIARAYTGNEGVIVTAHAYHGNTSTLAQLSPSCPSPGPRADWIETVPAPDSYRLAGELSDHDACALCLRAVDDAVARLAHRGVRPAALVLDSGFTSDGLLRAPPGFVAGAVERVRRAGGVFIADEVQVGFGRLGEWLWGFAAHGVEPDLVTLGKPMGNGYPIGAVVMRSQVLDPFARAGRYFNTFGGNPVSAAVGLAVLDVCQEERLFDNARLAGRYLHAKLKELTLRSSLIGDVRGTGLFAGVELVQDLMSKEPAAAEAARVVNLMRDRGVLISSTGPHGNVLKIRPPLPFQPEHVDQLVSTLALALCD